MGNDERGKLPASEQVGLPVTIPPKTWSHSSLLGWWKCARCVAATEMVVIDDELSRVARLRREGRAGVVCVDTWLPLNNQPHLKQRRCSSRPGPAGKTYYLWLHEPGVATCGGRKDRFKVSG